MGAAIKRKTAALLCAAVVFCLSVNAYALGDSLVPVGRAVGIKMEIDGALVSGFCEVETDRGVVDPAKECGIKVGDVIVELNGRRVRSAEDLMNALSAFEGSEMNVAVNRKGCLTYLKLKAERNSDGNLELGILVRDKISGVGTVTWYDPETGKFGALGHSVSDPETGFALPLRDGAITNVEISSVRTAAGGKPGELVGFISDDEQIGSVNLNCDSGIYGICEAKDFVGETLPAADAREIKTGRAELIATVDGRQAERFDIEITKIFGRGSGRDMLVEVKDERLINRTGGIVQGMSGCPIIQEGKLVGAVTHVLVNDPTKGYAISIERMLDAAA